MCDFLADTKRQRKRSWICNTHFIAQLSPRLSWMWTQQISSVHALPQLPHVLITTTSLRECGLSLKVFTISNHVLLNNNINIFLYIVIPTLWGIEWWKADGKQAGFWPTTVNPDRSSATRSLRWKESVDKLWTDADSTSRQSFHMETTERALGTHREEHPQGIQEKIQLLHHKVTECDIQGDLLTEMENSIHHYVTVSVQSTDPKDHSALASKKPFVPTSSYTEYVMFCRHVSTAAQRGSSQHSAPGRAFRFGTSWRCRDAHQKSTLHGPRR